MKVNEIFGPTIQGEGRSAGKLVIFLRLVGCNLACIWCDTPYTWNWLRTLFRHPEKHDPKKEIHEMSCRAVIRRLRKKGLRKVKALVISGGEPMLQQDEIIGLLRSLRHNNFLFRLLYRSKLFKKTDYWVEIETNGTIEPKPEFLELIDQINCSPKTFNSGPDNRPETRERPEALRKLSASSKTFFKFVIKDEEDLPEIRDLVSRYEMKNVYLMAQCRTREERRQLEPKVTKMCLENNFHFSPRLHILYWNGRRGV